MLIDPLAKRLFSQPNGHGPIVLMYHSIPLSAQYIDSPWSVRFEHFRAQLDLLQEYGWKTLCIRDLTAPPDTYSKTAIITFDDGYADNFRAFEELARRGMHASWYIVSQDIGGTARWKNPAISTPSILSKDQLLAMAKTGMEIGSHSRSHCRLTDVSDDTMRDEIEGSKAELEDILGQAVSSFAYPYGTYNDTVLNKVKDAGYLHSCTTRSGWALRDHDPFQIRRITVFGQDSLATYLRKLAFADNNVPWWRPISYYMTRMRSGFSG